MGIQLSGYSSGLPVNDIIAQLMDLERRPVTLLEQRKADLNLKSGLYNNVSSRVSDLLLSVRKLTSRSLLNTNLFKAKSATSSDDTIATAKATESASAQTINLEVVSLATATKAVSQSQVGQWVDTNTPLSEMSQGKITGGTISVYANGTRYEFAVDPETQTVGDVLQDIQSTIPQINGYSATDGVLSLDYTNNNTIILGSASDTSNFFKATHLMTGTDSGTSITGSNPNLWFNLSDTIDTADTVTAVTAGSTFEINGVSFDTTGKSLSAIIKEINNSSAKVTASFDQTSNTFQLVANDPGSALINLEDTSGNFLTAMGLIVAGDSTASQTAGSNAEFILNGSTLYAPSNSVDESITGLSGITLSLKEAAAGTTVTINIANDTSQIKTAVKDFIDKYNKLITYIDQQTNAEQKGGLVGESSLLRFRNQLRQMVTDRVSALSATGYDSLPIVGISTGNVSGTSAGVKSTLEFNESKFDAALAANPDAIRQLFIGQDLVGASDGSSSDDNMVGILTQIENLITDRTIDYGGGPIYGALYSGGSDSGSGLFPSYQSMIQRRIQSINKSIERGEERLERKEKLLRQQFQMMESLISQFQSQGTALAGLQQQLAANKR